MREVEGGFPHSEIHGSKPVRGSPWLIAAYHVLLRLSAPRHPPNTLTALDRSHCQCSPEHRRQPRTTEEHSARPRPFSRIRSHFAKRPVCFKHTRGRCGQATPTPLHLRRPDHKIRSRGSDVFSLHDVKQ